MRRDYRLYELSNDEFEQLVVQICVRRLGPGGPLFAPGKDHGRDGKFSRKANCAEFGKRCGRRSSGLRVKRGPPPALPAVLQARLSRCGEHHMAGDRYSSDRRDRPHSHSAEVFW